MNIPDPTLTDVKVISHPDTVTINHYTIQQLLRDHIETKTGRKVSGEVAILSSIPAYEVYQVGVANPMLKATAELEPK